MKNSRVLVVFSVAFAWLLSGCTTDVAGPNRAPTANAGIDRAVETGNPATLDGSQSFDPEGADLTFEWDIISAPAGATAAIDDDIAEVTSLTPNVPGIWLVRLVVSDGPLMSEPDVVRISAIDTSCQNDQDCNDYVDCTDDTCNLLTEICEFTPIDANCPDDGDFCNGTESCDAVSGCVSSGDPCLAGNQLCDAANGRCVDCLADADCDDQVDCTDDSCNIAAGTCENIANNSNCVDDGLYCNGPEICDSQTGCSSEGDPCLNDGLICDEAADECNTCLQDADCNDNIDCTADSCNVQAGTCERVPNDGLCPDDGDFCNGNEICDTQTGCIGSGDPCTGGGQSCDAANSRCVDCLADGDCDDLIGCTDDSCNLATGSCVYAPNDANCPDDNLHCNGTEYCDSSADCTNSGDPCSALSLPCDEINDVCVTCGDGVASDTQGEDCDPAAPQNDNCCDVTTCTWTADGDADPQSQCSGAPECRVDVCDGSGGCDLVDEQEGVLCTQDPDFCNGAEECQSGVCVSPGNPCPVEGDCDEDLNICAGCGDGEVTGSEDCDPAIGGTNCCDPLTCLWTSSGEVDPQGQCSGAPECRVDVCDGGGGCTVVDAIDGTGCSGDAVGCTDDECQSGSCQHIVNNSNCPDDGNFCNGNEFCDAVNDCDSTGDPCTGGGQLCDGANTRCVDCLAAGDCDDSVACTDNSCNPGPGTCVYTPNNDNCPNDGNFCNGLESCDAVSDCVSSGDPCTAGGQLCDGPNSRCVDCLAAGDCDDSVSCTDNSCNPGSGTCVYTPNNGNCPDDGIFCNGSEYCHAVNDCDHSGDPCTAGGQLCDVSGGRCVDCLTGADCDDTVDCTDNGCDSGPGTCTYTANDGNCPDDGDFCNGNEICHLINDCEHSGDPCTAGGQLCDVSGSRCVDCLAAGDCDDGATCTDDSCNPGPGTCLYTPNDGNCSGSEVCWPACSGAASGCLLPPDSLTLTCDDQVTLPADAACTISLTGGDNTLQAACLPCTAEVGVIILAETDFADDDNPTVCAPLVDGVADGWTIVTGTECYGTGTSCNMSNPDARDCCNNFPCPIDNDDLDGTIAFQADRDNCDNGDRQWRLERTFDTSGVTDLRLCYDYADRQAGGGNDAIQVEVSDGVDSQVLDCDVDGPVRDIENKFYRYCFDLPAWAADNSNLVVKFFLHSNDNNNRIYLDNISLSGWAGGCAKDIIPLLDDDFNDGGGNCDLSNWTITGTYTNCPGFDCDPPNGGWSPGIEADGSSFIMTTTVNAVDIDGEIEVCFKIGNDGANDGNSITLLYDAGSGPKIAWSQSGRLGHDKVCHEVCVDLSEIDALGETNNNPSLDISLGVTSADHKVDIYGVTITGAQYCQVDDSVVLLSTPVGDGLGNYDFTASDEYGNQLAADITCVWEPDSVLNDSATVTFLNDPAGWTKRRVLTFLNGGQAENLINFPVLVVLDSAWFDYNQTQDNGEDIRFLDENDSTVLAHEIEEWNEGGTSYIWVNVPQIDMSSDNDFIYMYYGNPLAGDGQDAENVWNAGYRAVWHLNEAVIDGDTGATHWDSTSNNNDGSQNWNDDGGGQISTGQYFDGSNDHISISQTGLQIAGQITIEAWARPTGEPNFYPHVVSGGADGRLWQLWWDASYNGWHGRLRVNGDYGGMYTYDGTFNGWNYLVLKYNGSNRRLFWDTFEIANESISGNLDAMDSAVWIGANPNLAPREFQGYIDEVRISDVHRSDYWIEAQFLSMTDAFIDYGAEQSF
jgi:concanavalin A-like lectin/glucanase superfamily protein/uncharacterized protein DUF2341